MNPSRRNFFAGLGVLYLAVLAHLTFDVQRASVFKDRRAADFSLYSKLYESLRPDASSPNASSEPLLIRLQKAAGRPELKDRAPKLSSTAAAPGLPTAATLGMEGVPFDNIALLLEGLSTDPNLTVTAFRIERAGSSDIRFDFSASFTEIPPSR